MLSQFNWLDATASSPIFLALIGFSIVTLAVVVERVLYFNKRRGNPEETARRVQSLLRSGNHSEALKECENSQHPIGVIAAELFRGALESAEERIYVALSQQKLLLERNLNVLGTMAAVAPLVGLLGTVWGIMRAFHDMAAVGSAAPSVVAAGVAEALVTTAAGLIVAVPALMIYNHFSRRLNVMLTVAENYTRSIRATMSESTSSATPSAPKAPRQASHETPAPEPAPVGAPVG
jgi:biopolymer transport protein ExbB